MGDYALQRRSSGKYDFVLADGTLAITQTPEPAILRQLIQDTWVGDDGERAGDSLGAVRIGTNATKDQVQRIVDRRLSVLVRQGAITSAEVLSVTQVGGTLFANISYRVAGQAPQNIQVPLLN